jgi:DNA-binding response OmpR family regulator
VVEDRPLSFALLALETLPRLPYSPAEPGVERSILILLAEDENLISLSLQAALEEAGFTVRDVSAGAEAMHELDQRRGEFSGVITDIRLESDIDGWAIARHARELIPNVPIVYMSGDSAHDHSIYGVPGSIMLQKPFADAQLVTAISTLLNSAHPHEQL